MRISDWSSDVCSSDLVEAHIDDDVHRLLVEGRAHRQHSLRPDLVHQALIVRLFETRGKEPVDMLGLAAFSVRGMDEAVELAELELQGRPDAVLPNDISMGADHVDRKSTRLNSSH